MAERPTRGALSDAELEVLKALWESGPSTVRRVNEALVVLGKSWAYTTVLTLLRRLQAKGWAESDTSGHAHIFRASATRDELLRDQMRSLADQYCEGASTPLVLALVDGRDVSPAELERLRTLLDRLDRAEGDPSGGSKPSAGGP